MGEPEPSDVACADATFAPEPVVSVTPGVVAELPGVAVVEGAVVVVPVVAPVVVPGFGTEEPGVPGPGAVVDRADVAELLGLAGVELVGFGLGVDGLVDEDDGLGFGAGLGAAAGGALLGAPPDPNANPMTLPGAGL